MRILDAADSLAAWEAGQALDPISRAVMLWGRACPELDDERRWLAPLGQRDAALMALRQASFGPRVECVAACPSCGEELEFAVDLRALQPTQPPPAPPWMAPTPAGPVPVRPVNSLDLRMLVQGEVEDLLERCVLDRTQTLDEESRAAVEAELERDDPLAEVSLSLDCPQCAARWSLLFDIGQHLWSDIEAEARGLLDEVDLLARTYHWSEAEILSLSRSRRSAYLSRAGA